MTTPSQTIKARLEMLAQDEVLQVDLTHALNGAHDGSSSPAAGG